MIELHGGHQLALSLGPLISQFPAAHVMTTGNNCRPNPCRYPGAHDVITNFSFHTQQIAGTHAEFCRMVRMNPKRIRMCDLIEPLGIGTARMNLYGQTKGRNQYRLIRPEIVGMNMTLNVSWNRKLGPAPLRQCARIEFQLAARRRKAALDFIINSYPHKSPAIVVAIGAV